MDFSQLWSHAAQIRVCAQTDPIPSETLTTKNDPNTHNHYSES